jgi:hypothetical protein
MFLRQREDVARIVKTTHLGSEAEKLSGANAGRGQILKGSGYAMVV